MTISNCAKIRTKLPVDSHKFFGSRVSCAYFRKKIDGHHQKNGKNGTFDDARDDHGGA